jgi:hypothetical protein
MHPISWFLLVLAELLVVAARYSASKFSIDDYLDLPEPKDFSKDEYHRNVRRALHDINLGKDPSLNSILVRIDSWARLEDDEHRSAVRRTLLKFGERKQDCDEDLVRLAKSVAAQTKDDPELRAKSAGLVDRLLRPKLRACALFRKSVIGLRPFDMRRFDTLFTRALDVDGRQASSTRTQPTETVRQLTTALQQLDLATDEFDARRVLEFARQCLSDSKHDVRRTESFEIVMDRTCESLDANYAHPLEIINIAAALDDDDHKHMTKDLIRRNEYRRICLAWRRKREAIMKNIQKHEATR